ncbi:MAG: hypothetical protein JXR41_07590 [Bacteroidales bacterium]|nr:hypothetical protein [Bacteroidales bacterium]MBN2762936.1 hypothetical protein [Bacteroidales bacterium]
MIYFIHFRNDIRQIVRDPIMLMLLFVPLLLICVFKLLIIFLVPALMAWLSFDLSPYTTYVLSFALLINAGVLGIITGFLMIDERDGNIVELMSVTPLGRFGYIVNRLSFVAIIIIVYSFITIYVLNLCEVNWLIAVYLALLMALYSAIIGLILFSGADDKVKGLTFAKGLNILSFFALTDLLALPWLTAFSWFFPPYWITAMLRSPDSALAYGMAFIVHAVWFGLLAIRYWRKG